MISRVARRFRVLRRKMSRTRWAARLFGVHLPRGENPEPGIILIQIDGLARRHLEQGAGKGRLPFISRSMKKGRLHLGTFYSGVPSTTPAVQAEIFFGVKAAVPAFQFMRRDTGRIFRMFEPTSAAQLESELLEKCPEPLLKDGHAYSNIYRAGAPRSWYCAQDLAVSVILNKSRPLKWLFLSVVYIWKILRMAGLALIELCLALIDCARGLFEKEDLMKELVFVPARIGVCILLREFIRFRVLLDIERGVRVIHANFLGYDEQAHRRGPDSDFAYWTLKGIDAAVRDIWRAAHRSDYRDYEVIIYSDHGQERTRQYAATHGRTIDQALTEVFAEGPLEGTEVFLPGSPKRVGTNQDRWGATHRKSGKKDADIPPSEHEGKIVVTAMGPIGHVYLPEEISGEDRAAYGARIVEVADVPLVLLKGDGGGTARIFAPWGEGRLPDDAERVLGKDHPFVKEAAADLIALTNHPDAGDFILSGWSPEEKPMTFPMENGAHAGPGRDETRGFVLLPDRFSAPLGGSIGDDRHYLRGADIHEMVKQYLGGTHHPITLSERPPVENPTLRVMTYNIHSCVGVDGKLRPERIARVINRLDPDIIAVQEVDAHRPRSLQHDQAKVIAEHLKMGHVFYSMLEEEKEKYGIAIFSRYPVQLVKSEFLTPADPRRRKEARGAIWVTIQPEGWVKPVHFINTHFGLGRDERRLQAEILLGEKWLGRIDPEEPVVVCGDFNSSARSRVWKRIISQYRDVQLAAHGHQPRATFATVRPFARLDHIFLSRHWEVKAVKIADFPMAMVASDHFPMTADLEIRKS